MTGQHSPLFSIIIPTYNRGEMVCLAVESALNQSFDDYEIVVVDDGSTDSTGELIAKLADANPRIRYFLKDNEERSIARNYGITKARGKYVNFLDSDDHLYPNHLQAAHELLKRNDFPEVGVLGWEVVSERGELIKMRNQNYDSLAEKLIHENIIHGNALLIRRDVARQINFISSPAAIVSEDWYVWLRLASRFPFHVDNTITCAVVDHPSRSLRRIDPDKLIKSTNLIVEHLQRDQAFLTKYRRSASYFFANQYTLVTLILALTKSRRADTLRYLLKAVRFDPAVIFRRRFLASLKHLIV